MNTTLRHPFVSLWSAIRYRAVLPLIALGVLGGALIGTLTDAFIASLFLMLLGGASMAVSFFVPQERRFLYLVLGLLVFSALLGVSRVFMFDRSFSRELSQFQEKKVSLEGTIVSAPEYKDSSVSFYVSVSAVASAPAGGRVLVSTNPYETLEYGNRVLVEGTLKEPRTFETQSGRLFNYQQYLHAHRTTHVVPFAHVSVVGTDAGNRVIAFLQKVKNALVGRIESILPDPEAPLLSGLLLGEKQSLGDSLYTSFQRAGVVHMIVLSGYNVSLVAQALIKGAGAFLPRVASLSIAGAGIVVFALMTGASETTVRASLMAGLLIVASVLRRPHDALRALLVAGAVMVLVNPYLLVYDLSFQLSFLATAGIIIFADTIAEKLSLLPKALGIRDIAGATLAAQIAVLPILIVSIGAVSVVSPFTNIIVLGAVPFAMAFGFLASMLSFIHPLVAFPATLVTEVLLTYILKVSVWFGNVPFASFNVPGPLVGAALFGTALLYGALLYVFMKQENGKKSPLRLGS